MSAALGEGKFATSARRAGQSSELLVSAWVKKGMKRRISVITEILLKRVFMVIL
jgi:hypothetical protein